MREVSQLEFREELSVLTDQSGRPTYRSISNIICRVVERWKVAPILRVVNHARGILVNAGFEEPEQLNLVREVCDHLTLLGILEPVYLGGRLHCARAQIRWLRLAENIAVITGTITDKEVLALSPEEEMGGKSGLLTKFDPSDIDVLMLLDSKEIQEWSFEEWRGEPGYVQHLYRRGVRSGEININQFWEILGKDLVESGMPLSDDAEICAITGEPGSFFGKGGESIEGRWSVNPSDGTWCGLRKGYSDSHWQPILLEVSNGRRRSIDFYDLNEWKWAIIARGVVSGAHEVTRREGDNVEFTYPLPDDIMRTLYLIGEPLKGWSWRVPKSVSDLWSA